MDQTHYGLTQETLQRILDHIYFEIYITDEDMNILYVSTTSEKHYGLKPAQMLGHSHLEFVGKYWYSSVLPYTYNEKRDMCIEQMTVTGMKIISSTTPILDEEGRVRMVVSVVQERLSQIDAPAEEVQTPQVIARSAKMQALLALAQKAANCMAPLLIQGPSGTGKTLLARYIHEHSDRRRKPFLSINCAAIPENLLESELFGYAPHAFTGASVKGKQGLIELASGGTLFLDEIGELSPLLQTKLLDVIENKRFLPVGGDSMRQIDVRILSATNRDLRQMVLERRFREDLFWRLNVVILEVPSLLERREDILPLANYYLNLFNKKSHSNKYFSPAVLDTFLTYPFPGNVRQLKNLVERICCTAGNHLQIGLSDLPPFLLRADLEQPPDASLAAQLEVCEGNYIRAMLAHHTTSRRLAAALGITQSKAARLIRKYAEDPTRT